jgi:hypothetical protein
MADDVHPGRHCAAAIRNGRGRDGGAPFLKKPASPLGADATNNLAAIQRALEAAGVEFIPGEWRRPGRKAQERGREIVSTGV